MFEDRIKLNEPMQDWADRGIQVKGSACDVTCREQRVELMNKVSSAFDGKLNILVRLYMIPSSYY